MKILYKHVNKYNGICINKYGKYEPFEGSQPVLLRALGVLTSSHPHHKRMKEPPPLSQRGRQRLRHVGSFAQGHTDAQVAELGFNIGIPGSSARPWPLPHCLSDWAVTSWWVTNQCGRFSVVFQKNKIE